MARLQLLARRNGVPRLGALRVVLQRKEQLVALFQLPEHVPRTRFVPVAERRHVRRHRDPDAGGRHVDDHGHAERTVPLVDQPPVPDPRLGGANQERQRHRLRVRTDHPRRGDPQRPTVLRQTQLQGSLPGGRRAHGTRNARKLYDFARQGGRIFCIETVPCKSLRAGTTTNSATPRCRSG